MMTSNYRPGDVVILGAAQVRVMVSEVRMHDGQLCAMAVSERGHRYAIPAMTRWSTEHKSEGTEGG